MVTTFLNSALYCAARIGVRWVMGISLSSWDLATSKKKNCFYCGFIMIPGTCKSGNFCAINFSSPVLERWMASHSFLMFSATSLHVSQTHILTLKLARLIFSRPTILPFEMRENFHPDENFHFYSIPLKKFSQICFRASILWPLSFICLRSVAHNCHQFTVLMKSFPFGWLRVHLLQMCDTC